MQRAPLRRAARAVVVVMLLLALGLAWPRESRAGDPAPPPAYIAEVQHVEGDDNSLWDLVYRRGTESRTLATGIRNGGLQPIYDPSGRSVLWSDIFNIRKAGLAGEGAVDLRYERGAEHLAIDPSTRTLFWSGRGAIMKGTLDDGGLGEERLAVTCTGVVTDLEFDGARRRLYWLDNSEERYRLCYAKLDAPSPTAVTLVVGTGWSWAVEIVPERAMVLWTSAEGVMMLDESTGRRRRLLDIDTVGAVRAMSYCRADGLLYLPDRRRRALRVDLMTGRAESVPEMGVIFGLVIVPEE